MKIISIYDGIITIRLSKKLRFKIWHNDYFKKNEFDLTVLSFDYINWGEWYSYHNKELTKCWSDKEWALIFLNYVFCLSKRVMKNEC